MGSTPAASTNLLLNQEFIILRKKIVDGLGPFLKIPNMILSYF